MASTNENIAIELIADINTRMTIDIKDLGRLTCYNGVDITQAKYYIKQSFETYIDKLLEEHDWLLNDDIISNQPIPIKNEQNFNQKMESAQPPILEDDKQKLQLEMGLNYRQAVGELIFIMITCRPDISFPLIKLSQYSVNLAYEHYDAIKQIFRYIKATKTDGIYFWQQHVRDDLPVMPLPKCTENSYVIDPMVQQDQFNKIHGTVDSD